MSQLDPPTDEDKKRPAPLAGCAFGTIAFAFLVLGILILATLGMCVRTGSATALLLLATVAGIPPLIAAALLDAALYLWGWSSGRFGKAALPVVAVVLLLGCAWFATLSSVPIMTRLESGLGAAALAVALGLIALRIKSRSRGDH